MTNWRIIRSQTIGKIEEFAIEWGLSEAFPRPSHWAIGYFVIYINGRSFGVKAADATMLAASYNDMCKRLKERGAHCAPYSSREAAEIVSAVKAACYSDTRPGDHFLDLSEEEIKTFLYRGDILWAPDGDEAFDDGSHVLHFDIGDQVRLIGFVNMNTVAETLSTITEVTVDAETFYSALQLWVDSITIARTKLLNGR